MPPDSRPCAKPPHFTRASVAQAAWPKHSMSNMLALARLPVTRDSSIGMNMTISTIRYSDKRNPPALIPTDVGNIITKKKKITGSGTPQRHHPFGFAVAVVILTPPVVPCGANTARVSRQEANSE